MIRQLILQLIFQWVISTMDRTDNDSAPLYTVGNSAGADIMDNKIEQKIDAPCVKLEKVQVERPIVTSVLLHGYGWGNFYVLTPRQTDK